MSLAESCQTAEGEGSGGDSARQAVVRERVEARAAVRPVDLGEQNERFLC